MPRPLVRRRVRLPTRLHARADPPTQGQGQPRNETRDVFFSMYLDRLISVSAGRRARQRRRPGGAPVGALRAASRLAYPAPRWPLTALRLMQVDDRNYRHSGIYMVGV